MSLISEAEQLIATAQQELQAGATTESLKRSLLGSQGSFKDLLRQLKDLSPDERRIAGARLQELRLELEALLTSKDTSESSFISGHLDPTVPAQQRSYGTIHPISAMIEEMVDIFERLAFEVVEGPELVSDVDNFEVLNMGPDHPARDGHDSFYINPSILLRTQTTAVQVLEMKRRLKAETLPMRVVVPGKAYRRESDQTHSAMFHQIDAIVVDTQTTFADLKGSLDYFVKQLFGNDVETRFRPHNFPFTEPSAELDIRWKGTSTTSGKHTEWLEMGGCGMIHPAVLKRAGINPKVYQGWAYGMSIERPVMVRYGIPDIRSLYENTLPFLEQFN